MPSPYKVKIPVKDGREVPEPKTYFQVLLRYNPDAKENETLLESGEGATSMESPPLETERKAEEVLEAVCRDITERIKGAEVVELSVQDRIDDFSVVVIRERKTKEDPVFILARLGIVKVDYSKESIH